MSVDKMFFQPKVGRRRIRIPNVPNRFRRKLHRKTRPQEIFLASTSKTNLSKYSEYPMLWIISLKLRFLSFSFFDPRPDTIKNSSVEFYSMPESINHTSHVTILSSSGWPIPALSKILRWASFCIYFYFH